MEPQNKEEEFLVTELEEAQVDKSDLYTLGNLEKTGLQGSVSLVRKFSQIRFRRSSNAISRTKVYRLQSRSCSGFSSRGDYKTEVVTETRFDSFSYDNKYVTSNYQDFATTEQTT